MNGYLLVGRAQIFRHRPPPLWAGGPTFFLPIAFVGFDAAMFRATSQPAKSIAWVGASDAAMPGRVVAVGSIGRALGQRFVIAILGVSGRYLATLGTGLALDACKGPRDRPQPGKCSSRNFGAPLFYRQIGPIFGVPFGMIVLCRFVALPRRDSFQTRRRWGAERFT